MAVKDELTDLVSENEDSVDTWQILKVQFQLEDVSQIVLFTKLHRMRMQDS